jgi:hypothetical protein
MFSQEEIPDDPGEASQLARSTLTDLMTRYQTVFMEYYEIPKQPARSVMPLVFLVDSPSGEKIQWEEPDTVSTISSSFQILLNMLMSAGPGWRRLFGRLGGRRL